MSDTDNVSKEEQDFFDEISCSLNVSIDKEDNLSLDIMYDTKEDLKNLCKLIILVKNTDFLYNYILGLDMKEEDRQYMIECLSSKMEDLVHDSDPVIWPTEVFRNAGDI